MRIVKISKSNPLCFLPDRKLVCYKNGVISEWKDNDSISTFRIFDNFREKYFGELNFVARLCRAGIRSALPITNSVILLSVGSSVFEYNIEEHTLSNGCSIGSGIRPLVFSIINNIDGFDYCVVFGGYLSNLNKKPVHIYKRINVDEWEIIYTFPHGEINHVHNIIPDPYRNCLWIFTGDFDESAAIWKVTDNFKKVERVLCNDQKYRGCVCFPVKEGLIYATDAPFAQNYIYLMTPDYKVTPIREIDGSCIYACQVGDKYVFSSTVEPDGRKNTLFRLFTYMKRGAGIKDTYVHMYAGNMEVGFKEIYKEKKDWWPYAFQFGAFRFPTGENKSSKLYFQPVATSKHDLELMCIDLDEVFKD